MSNDSPLKGFRPIRDINDDNQHPDSGVNQPASPPTQINTGFNDPATPSIPTNDGFSSPAPVNTPQTTVVDQGTVLCPSCHFQNSSSAKFCGNCGYPMNGSQPGDISYQIPGQSSSGQNSQPKPSTQNPYQPNPGNYYQAPGTGYMPGYPTKSKGTAKLLEILIGLLFLSGAGWIYAGETGKGIGFMFGSLMLGLIGAVTLGFGYIITVPLQILLIVLSVNGLNKHMNQNPQIFHD